MKQQETQLYDNYADVTPEDIAIYFESLDNEQFSYVSDILAHPTKDNWDFIFRQIRQAKDNLIG